MFPTPRERAVCSQPCGHRHATAATRTAAQWCCLQHPHFTHAYALTLENESSLSVTLSPQKWQVLAQCVQRQRYPSAKCCNQTRLSGALAPQHSPSFLCAAKEIPAKPANVPAPPYPRPQRIMLHSHAGAAAATATVSRAQHNPSKFHRSVSATQHSTAQHPRAASGSGSHCC